jgi:hypothetical protein
VRVALVVRLAAGSAGVRIETEEHDEEVPVALFLLGAAVEWIIAPVDDGLKGSSCRPGSSCATPDVGA